MNQCKRISVNALVQLLKNPENGDQCKKISAKNSPPFQVFGWPWQHKNDK